jgi:hypothetical protein
LVDFAGDLKSPYAEVQAFQAGLYQVNIQQAPLALLLSLMFTIKMAWNLLYNGLKKLLS